MSETRLQQRIVRAFEKRGTFAVRQRLSGRKGWPDLFIIAPCCGRACHVEVKLPGNVATKLQQEVLKQLRKAGAVTGVATSVDEAFRILDQHICGAF